MRNKWILSHCCLVESQKDSANRYALWADLHVCLVWYSAFSLRNENIDDNMHNKASSNSALLMVVHSSYWGVYLIGNENDVKLVCYYFRWHPFLCWFAGGYIWTYHGSQKLFTISWRCRDQQSSSKPHIRFSHWQVSEMFSLYLGLYLWDGNCPRTLCWHQPCGCHALNKYALLLHLYKGLWQGWSRHLHY